MKLTLSRPIGDYLQLASCHSTFWPRDWPFMSLYAIHNETNAVPVHQDQRPGCLGCLNVCKQQAMPR
jgi:NAD-dependent dihydropyrimidine dehydrogenase PreA subunit